jgi:hemolysin D
VIGAGSVLVTVVPAGDPLEADVVIRNEDVGFVRAGHKAQVKVAAFPFQKYGLVQGDVVRVGPDASEPGAERNGESSSAAPGYRARIALRTQSLTFEETRLALVPGMQASAEIHLGRRPVLEYLLAPLRKAWHEAARER